MFNNKFLNLALAAAAVGIIAPNANAQGTRTFFDPYIPGTLISPPLVPPATPPMEAPGMGPTPPPVNPGMPGPAELMPWVPAIPADPFGQANTGLGLPLGSAALTPPGVLGPAMSGFIPPPDSAPGPIPPYLNAVGGPNPTDEVQVPNGGVLPGTGGYYTTINKVRKGGQKTQQFGSWLEQSSGLPSILGGGGPNQDEVTLTGPLAGWGIPFGIPTGVGYNNGPAGSNNDLYSTSVDLGGGPRMKVGGNVISTDQTIQDYGQNILTQSPIGGLTAQQSTDYGQGLHSLINNGAVGNAQVSKTTDFGFKFQPFNAANLDYGDRNPGGSWLLPPQAVETNF
jgi:hypothetical protein